MKITKYGHCCLLIQVKGLSILTDPGSYSAGFTDLVGINVILITHEHADHLHIDSLKQVLQNNPQAQVVTNSAVAKLLDGAGINYKVVADGQSTSIDEVTIEGMGKEHAVIYPSLPAVENTGYFIDGSLFYPGDSFYKPNKAVDILALPVAGPWMKISEAIEYALEIHPRLCFPVHDGILKYPGNFSMLPQTILSKVGIEFRLLEHGKATEL